MPERDDDGQNLRDSRIFDPAAETPSRAERAAPRSLIDPEPTQPDRGGAELHIDPPADENSDTLPPPSAHRADTMVRAVGPDARQEMENGGVFSNQASFTKGINAPTTDQARLPYTVEQMDEMLTEAPRGLFPDTPGGDGATPLSRDRETFLETMGERGHFPSRRETERWARSVFNGLRHYAVEQDETVADELHRVVRYGEAPEVQVEEMMWGGDFLERIQRMLILTSQRSRRELYEQVAEEAGETPDDPWVDVAVYSFLGSFKALMGDDANRIGQLGELQEVWDRS
jgi:uncharacterized protein (DUF2267 family)